VPNLQSGAIEVDGIDPREFDVSSWRSRITAVFQDFIRFELPMRDNVAPAGAPDDIIRAALYEARRGQPSWANVQTVLSVAVSEGGNRNGK
jgi:ATP-binding cassette, subfamily B, bacterial